MQCIALFLGFLHSLTGFQVLGLVERVAKALACLLDLLLNLLVIFCNLILNQDVSAITFLRVAVVNQGVVESIDMT